MTLSVPHGYQGTLISLERVREIHQAKYHPEAWRRIEAIIVASDGLLGLADGDCLCGIGGGSRTRDQQAANYAANPNVFAPPDLSFHEIWKTWKSGATGAQAVDWIGRNGRHEEAWRWLRDNGGRFGLLTFWNVNGEPWHSQCLDIPKSVSAWKAAGYPDPGHWPIDLTPTPEPDYGLWPLNPDKPEIQQGSFGDGVTYAQRVLRDKANQKIKVDGLFGENTATAVAAVQAYFGLLPVDRKINKNEWDLLDALVGVHHVAPAPVDPSDTRVEKVNAGFYWVQHGDSPYGVTAKVYGNGNGWPNYFTKDQFAKPDVSIPLPVLPGVRAGMLGGEGPYQVIRRMYPSENPYAVGRLERFYELNGGKHRVLHPGTQVFLDLP